MTLMDLPRRNTWKTFRHMRIPPPGIVFSRSMKRNVLVGSSPRTPPRHRDVDDRAEEEEHDQLGKTALHRVILRPTADRGSQITAAHTEVGVADVGGAGEGGYRGDGEGDGASLASMGAGLIHEQP